MSIDAIKLINEWGIPCVVLAKGILPIELAELSDINQYGITLVSLDENFREEMEPGAAPPADRLAALKALSDAGCKTWASRSCSLFSRRFRLRTRLSLGGYTTIGARVLMGIWTPSIVGLQTRCARSARRTASIATSRRGLRISHRGTEA